MNETSRSNNGGRRNFMEQANNGRSGGGMIQRNQYLNPSLPGPIPSIGNYRHLLFVFLTSQTWLTARLDDCFFSFSFFLYAF